MDDRSLERTAARLRRAGSVFAEDEAALLHQAASGSASLLEELVDRRAGGEPIQHVVGWAELCGRRFVVSPGVFIPRPRSEWLVRVATAAGKPHGLVVDLCCGAGALGLLVADGLDAELHGADIDPAAVACARENYGPRGNVHLGDLFRALPPSLAGRIDLLVANAPYVPTDDLRLLPSDIRGHEPNAALDGGADGLEIHRRIAGSAGRWLTFDGLIAIEVTAHQLHLAMEMFEAAGFDPTSRRDYGLDATAVVARRR